MDSDLRKACTKNRAEELGLDVWEHFAIPLFFDKLDIGSATKPCRFTGGRGCGKTMLLRYLSHQSAFSPKRKHYDDSVLKQIGLYWKVDTHFANLLVGRNIPEDVWQSAFAHFTSLAIALDAIQCLVSIAASSFSGFSLEELSHLSLNSSHDFDPTLPLNAIELKSELGRRQRAFQTWANNPRTVSPPTFLPGREFVEALVREIIEKVKVLSESVFFIYIDEYENLRDEQQRLINTYIKHSEPPLIFNIATKRNGMRTNATVGAEKITEIADFRTYDLDSMLETTDFDQFAAEVLFFRFATMGGAKEVPISVEQLRDPAALPARRSATYRSSVINAAKKIFPGLTEPELASYAMGDESISRLLEKKINKAIKNRGEGKLDAEAFMDQTNPRASFVVPALLHRMNLKPQEVLDEFNWLREGKPNRFSGPTGWIQNNFVGCFLQLYVPFARTCPFYAGFDSFIGISRGNLRHFLEICHNSLKHIGEHPVLTDLVVGVEEQAESARQASADFLREIRSSGPYGNQLYDFACALGKLFALAHRRPSQSEPEINHFSIREGVAALSSSDREFLDEATKWSVLIELEETKTKSESSFTGTEWMLAPIYAPYFRITFRKKRRVELTRDELTVLINGPRDLQQGLYEKFERRWIDSRAGEPTLFDFLTEEDE
jgi:hypothetical protein